MKIKRIIKIKGVGILQNLNTNNLSIPDLDFKNINLIFGWNGTGKTTLSRVLRCYELGEICTKLQKYPSMECDIELDNGSRLSQMDFTTKKHIRVFNKDFVDENIFQDKEQDGGNVRPFYYLGREKIELTKERKERDSKKIELGNLETEYRSKNKEKDKFAKDIAKEIKDALLGIKKFQHYHKDNFINAFDTLKGKVSKGEIEFSKLIISEQNFNKKLKSVKNFEALKSWIEEIKGASAKITTDYINSIEGILEKTVSVQKTIEKLKTDWELSNWIQSGILIHKKRKSAKCEFCEQELSVNKIDDLEKHFNKDYVNLSNLIAEKLDDLESLKIEQELKIPDEEIKKIAILLNNLLDKLIVKIKSKQKNILKKQTFDKKDKQKFIDEFKQINIDIENTRKTISSNAEELEISLVVDHFKEYDEKNNSIESINKRKELLNLNIVNLDKTIKEGEKSVKNFDLPAEEINKGLERFLGHSELKFKKKKDENNEIYYEINRNNKVAFNLSESEKTAISLMYFLGKLKESDFKLSEDLVFIDDPISSMDSQFMYSAYAFIVAAIEKDVGGDLKVGQFFLSTHSYDFFNLFKKKYWKNKEPKKRRCNLYILRVKLDSTSNRCSNIYELDDLLKKFDSDYQYLYSSLIEFEKASEAEQNSLEKIYSYPNIARRVLETFLSFKFPAKTDLQAKINAVNNPNINKETKESVYRFVNIKSHGTLREIEGFSPEILEPNAKDHILDVLKIMRELDCTHCSEIENSIG